MVNASLVCRRFHDILEPEIYKDVRAPSSDLPDCCIDEAGTKYKTLRLFTRTIIARPELGRLVRSVSICVLADDEITECRSLRRLCSSKAKQCKAPHLHEASQHVLASAAARIGLPGDLFDHGVPGLIVLLLHFVPKMHTLFMDSYEDVDIMLSAALGHLGSGVPAGMQSIHNFDMYLDEEHLGFCTDTILAFMQLPTLAEITLHGFDRDEAEEAGIVEVRKLCRTQSLYSKQVQQRITSAAKPRSLPTTSLKLSNCIPDCEAMDLILTLPRRLQTFEYAAGYDPEFPFCPHLFFSGLCTQADSLERLVITDMDVNDERRVPFVLGSLIGFTSLAYLVLMQICS